MQTLLVGRVLHPRQAAVLAASIMRRRAAASSQPEGRSARR